MKWILLLILIIVMGCAVETEVETDTETDIDSLLDELNLTEDKPLVSTFTPDPSAVYDKEYNNFSIYYSWSGPWSRGEHIINISQNGSFEYLQTSFAAEPGIINHIEAKLTYDELKELALFVVKDNDFFHIPESMVDRNCYDANSERIGVTFGNRYYEVGAYCNGTQEYDRIQGRILSFKDQFT
ncbi:hypothetical protein ACFLZB_00530 [Nanoarchaeota archaeon]